MKLIFACLLFLSCSVGDKSNSQVTEASALTSNVQENKSEQETKTAKEANSVQGNLGLELSQTHFTNKPQVVTLTITNNSPWTCIVGYEYFIEKENKGWKKIPLKNAAFIEIGLGIRPNTARKFQIDLGNVRQKYTKGTYRIGKKNENRDNRRLQRYNGLLLVQRLIINATLRTKRCVKWHCCL
ncbi:MAG: hypothetical protein L6V92_05640 [Phocaeicola vulgatus]|nr:MAG: hypothetical protein L6V92_05640 [Phocaeicola vulgatus]